MIDTGVAYEDTKKGKQARDFGRHAVRPRLRFREPDALPNDDQGHGTHVAGTIAESTDNNEGVAGLAFEAKIMPLKVLSASGGGSLRRHRRSHSLGGGSWRERHQHEPGRPVPRQADGARPATYAHKKGVTIVCAAGNSGREGVGYPAAYKDCIAVSAVGPNGDLSFYSSWGKQVAIAAPGGDKQVGGEARRHPAEYRHARRQRRRW